MCKISRIWCHWRDSSISSFVSQNACGLTSTRFQPCNQVLNSLCPLTNSSHPPCRSLLSSNKKQKYIELEDEIGCDGYTYDPIEITSGFCREHQIDADLTKKELEVWAQGKDTIRIKAGCDKSHEIKETSEEQTDRVLKHVLEVDREMRRHRRHAVAAKDKWRLARDYRDYELKGYRVVVTNNECELCRMPQWNGGRYRYVHYKYDIGKMIVAEIAKQLSLCDEESVIDCLGSFAHGEKRVSVICDWQEKMSLCQDCMSLGDLGPEKEVGRRMPPQRRDSGIDMDLEETIHHMRDSGIGMELDD